MLAVTTISGFGAPSVFAPNVPKLKAQLRALALKTGVPKLDPGRVTGPVDMRTLAAVLHLGKFMPGPLGEYGLSGITSLGDALSEIAPFMDQVIPWINKALAAGAGNIPYVGQVAEDIVAILDGINALLYSASGGLAAAIELWINLHGGPLVPPAGLDPEPEVVTPSGGGAPPPPVVKYYPAGTIVMLRPGGGYRVAIPRR